MASSGKANQHQSNDDGEDEEEWLRKYRAREKKFREDLEAKRNLQIVDVGTDGNCLFRAVALIAYGHEEFHMMIRRMSMEYILVNKDYFKDYIDLDKYANIEQYCEHKSHDTIWGDDLEIQALSEIYNCPIEIFAYSD